MEELNIFQNIKEYSDRAWDRRHVPWGSGTEAFVGERALERQQERERKW